MSSLVGEEVELIDSMWRRAEESSLYPWREEILMLALCIAKSWCSWRMGREKINADWMFLVQKYGQSCTLTICQSFQPYDATCKELLLCCLPLEICWPDVYVPERLGHKKPGIRRIKICERWNWLGVGKRIFSHERLGPLFPFFYQIYSNTFPIKIR